MRHFVWAKFSGDIKRARDAGYMVMQFSGEVLIYCVILDNEWETPWPAEIRKLPSANTSMMYR